MIPPHLRRWNFFRSIPPGVTVTYGPAGRITIEDPGTPADRLTIRAAAKRHRYRLLRCFTASDTQRVWYVYVLPRALTALQEPPPCPTT